MLMLLLLSCVGREPELVKFSFLRIDCSRRCIGLQELNVPAEYWGEFGDWKAIDFSFFYAGMYLYAPRWDSWGAEALYFDPMWGVPDPWCDSVRNIGNAMESWPACEGRFDPYPWTEECL